MSELALVEGPPTLVALQAQVSQAAANMAAIREIQDSILIKGQDYGEIPSTDKPTLLKSGAEKLLMAFQLTALEPRVEIEREGDHRTYTVYTPIAYRPTGQIVGCGIGIASTKESKYRYRWQTTVKPATDEEAERLKAEGLGRWKKNHKGQWDWARKVENPDLADVYNTIIKMGQKRSLVGGALITCAASQFFTQDLDEIEHHDDPAPAPAPAPQGNMQVQRQQPQQTTNPAVQVDPDSFIGKESNIPWGQFYTYTVAAEGSAPEGKRPAKFKLNAGSGKYEQVSIFSTTVLDALARIAGRPDPWNAVGATFQLKLTRKPDFMWTNQQNETIPLIQFEVNGIEDVMSDGGYSYEGVDPSELGPPLDMDEELQAPLSPGA